MPPSRAVTGHTAYLVILAVSLCHLLNDVMQSLLAAIYPILQAEFALAFWQIGLLTFAFQATASVLQPAIGLYTDKHPVPRSLPIGMGASILGLVLLAFAEGYPMLLLGAALIGIGSSVFHPEASRVARQAAGGRFGMAQSVFQVGGNTGTAIGPLLAAFVVVPIGRPALGWFALAALAGMLVLWQVAAWHARVRATAGGRRAGAGPARLPRTRVAGVIVILALLMLSKSVYQASVTSYYTFFLIDRFALSTQAAQVMLFVFLAGLALGTVAGGPLADRFGATTVITASALGALPFTLALPHLDLFWTGILSVVIGVIMASTFPVIVVFAQELLPGRVGLVAGIFFGLSFGIAGLAAALLGILADARGIAFVYRLCAVLPAIGVVALLLPRRRELLGPG